MTNCCRYNGEGEVGASREQTHTTTLGRSLLVQEERGRVSKWLSSSSTAQPHSGFSSGRGCDTGASECLSGSHRNASSRSTVKPTTPSTGTGHRGAAGGDQAEVDCGMQRRSRSEICCAAGTRDVRRRAMDTRSLPGTVEGGWCQGQKTLVGSFWAASVGDRTTRPDTDTPSVPYVRA